MEISVKEYQILSAGPTDNFAKALGVLQTNVNAAINAGWQPLGGIAIDSTYTLMQAMVR